MNSMAIPNFLLSREIEGQARRDRLARLRRVLAEHDLGAAVLFDSINLRTACGVTNMQLNTARNPGRYVFVPSRGSLVLFEYAGRHHLSRGVDSVDEVRPAHAFYPLYTVRPEADKIYWRNDLAGIAGPR